MTLVIPGEEAVGYTYKAENYPARQIIEALESSALRFPNWYDFPSVEGKVRQIAMLNEIEYDDPRSYDSDDFPKPIYEDQLGCSDVDWTDLAPGHQFPFIPGDDGVYYCRFCGAPNKEE